MIKAYKKFFAFSSSYKKEWVQGILLEILNIIVESFQFIAIFMMLHTLLSTQRNPRYPLYTFLIMLISVALSTMCWRLSHTKIGDASYKSTGQKRIQIGESLKHMPMGRFGGHSLGNITAVATTTIDDLQAMANAVIVRTLTGVMYSIIMSTFMMIFDWRIGCIFLIGTLIFIFINGLMLKRLDKASPIRLEAQIELVDAALEYIQGMSVVKSFHLSQNANSNIEKTIDHTQKQNLKMERLRIPYTFFENAVLYISSVLVVLTSIYLYLNGMIEIHACLLIIIFAYMMYSRLFAAGKMFSMLPMIISSIDRVEEICNEPAMDTNKRDIDLNNFNIELENVSFGYNSTPIIKNISLKIPQLTTTAIVGPSGSGKTTLCNLLLRFWDATEGTVTIGGVDVREYSSESLLKNFGMVFQDVYLFNDTIENNIKFGKPNASREEVVQAAKQACCHEFISGLPHGYDTVLGEGGSTVSGGEKQRISIARAIMKDAPIIILDEATANVDPENEHLLNKAIAELTQNKTVIMIAHRMKTIKDADQIVVLDKGQIVQKGRHNELVKDSDSIYANFVQERQKAECWTLGNLKTHPAL